MPRAATYLVCYDVTDDAERARVANVVEGFGFRVQYSVFECRLSRTALEEMRRQLEALGLTSGGALICRLDERARRYQVGVSRASEPLSGRSSHSFQV